MHIHITTHNLQRAFIPSCRRGASFLSILIPTLGNSHTPPLLLFLPERGILGAVDRTRFDVCGCHVRRAVSTATQAAPPSPVVLSGSPFVLLIACVCVSFHHLTSHTRPAADSGPPRPTLINNRTAPLGFAWGSAQAQEAHTAFMQSGYMAVRCRRCAHSSAENAVRAPNLPCIACANCRGCRRGLPMPLAADWPSAAMTADHRPRRGRLTTPPLSFAYKKSKLPMAPGAVAPPTALGKGVPADS